MAEQNSRTTKELQHMEKRKTEDATSLAREQVRKEAYHTREQTIEKNQEAKAAKRAEKNSAEETKQLAKEKDRKQSFTAREKLLAEAEVVRKNKENNQYQ